jgi:murein L,D-transpeptidase YafK
MRRILIYLSLIWIGATGPAHAQSDGEAWVMIDVAKQTLSIFQDDHVKQIFRNISVGRNGYTLERHEGDGKTPLGVFHVAWINPNSRFHLFFGLDYPNQQYAEAALRHKIIDYDTYAAINRALYRGDLPPQDTPLGGNIGIHGIGHGSRFVHETTNWTEGCIALTNEQIDKLAHWITLGTKVVIY